MIRIGPRVVSGVEIVLASDDARPSFRTRGTRRGCGTPLRSRTRSARRRRPSSPGCGRRDSTRNCPRSSVAIVPVAWRRSGQRAVDLTRARAPRRRIRSRRSKARRWSRRLPRSSTSASRARSTRGGSRTGSTPRARTPRSTFAQSPRPGGDDGVVGAAEEKDALGREVGRRVDRPGGGEALRAATIGVTSGGRRRVAALRSPPW